MNEPIRVGVFGVGSLGQHHARIYSELEGVELAGVFDTDTRRAETVAAACRTRAWPTAEDLAGAVQAASVAVPTDRHHALTMSLLERDVHVLVEKPIASDFAEAEAMVTRAEQRRCILQVGHVERFNPVIQFLERNLDRPRFIEAIRLAAFPPPRAGAPPRGTEVSVVLDLMIHDLDIILHLVGAPVSGIHAVGIPVLSTTEDIANVRLEFANGCIANVTASRISTERMRKIRVFQPDAYVSLDYQHQCGKLCRKRNGTIDSTPVPMEKGEPLADELASFMECVRTRSTPVVTARHASEALKLAVDICRHIRERPS